MFDIQSLNAAQLEAVTAGPGPVLVIAGAGSGKTRTLVHRLAWLIQEGINPSSMLLLTFTRKASREMLRRAEALLPHSLYGVQGGTFHSFAFSVLRQYRPSWATGRVVVMDSGDSLSILQDCKAELKLGKGDRTFPRGQAIMGLLSKTRNKELTLGEIINNDAPHLLAHEPDLQSLQQAYAIYKRERNLLDYDDLLFELEELLHNDGILSNFQEQIKYLMVDEYQDTNLVQARLTRLLAGANGNIMAVGDDAQSIYAFRGANVRNILDFMQVFPSAKIVHLEENYRSTPPILDVANAILAEAHEGFHKHLFTTIKAEVAAPLVRIIKPFNDHSQARLVAARVEELLAQFQASEIAILFRAGYQSYHLEVELSRRQLKFRKFGGLRYSEALHIKDVLAYIRLRLNPLDEVSFKRLASLSKGIGPKTASKLYQALSQADQAALQKFGAKFPDFMEDVRLLDALRHSEARPVHLLEQIIQHYLPKMQLIFPDDWPRRKQGLDEMLHIAESYTDLEEFAADLSLDNPELSEDEESCLTLSTIHSAKGLEWDAVIIIDLVAERFPSRHAMLRPEDLEEERRLMYVACTRARESLDLCVPTALYNRQFQGNDPVLPSVFVHNLPYAAIEEWQEGYLGSLQQRETPAKLPYKLATKLGVQETSFEERSQAGEQFKAGGRSQAGEQSGAGGRSQAGEQSGAGGKFKDGGRSDYNSRSISPTNNSCQTRMAGSKPSPTALDSSQTMGLTQKKPAETSFKCGFCRHKIFGRGKIVEQLPPDKCRVNFPGFGLKVIMTSFLELET